MGNGPGQGQLSRLIAPQAFAAAGVEHHCAALILQGMSQRHRQGCGQMGGNPIVPQMVQRDLQAFHGRGSEKFCHLAVSAGLVGAHQNDARLRLPPWIPPPQARQIPMAQKLGTRINQGVNQTGRSPAQIPIPLLTPSLHQLTKAVEVLRLTGVYGHHSTLGEGRQTAQEVVGIGGFLPVNACDRRLWDAAGALLLHPCHQLAGGVAKAAVLGIAAEVDWPAMEKVTAANRGATTRQERRQEKPRRKWPQLLAEHLGIQREMAAQRGIPPAHQLPILQIQLLQCQAQVAADGAKTNRRVLGGQSTGVGQDEEHIGGVLEPFHQRFHTPT